MTGGLGGSQILRPFWSHLDGLVRPQGSIMYTVPFPRWSSGVALDQGLAEWHPVGCFLGEGELRELGLEGDGGSEGLDDALVVCDIVKGEGGIASILQPLL